MKPANGKPVSRLLLPEDPIPNHEFPDGKKIQLSNVMIGEVWICSGQSNMEMPLAGWGKVLHYEQEIAAADHPDIRLFQIKKKKNNFAYALRGSTIYYGRLAALCP